MICTVKNFSRFPHFSIEGRNSSSNWKSFLVLSFFSTSSGLQNSLIYLVSAQKFLGRGHPVTNKLGEVSPHQPVSSENVVHIVTATFFFTSFAFVGARSIIWRFKAVFKYNLWSAVQ